MFSRPESSAREPGLRPGETVLPWLAAGLLTLAPLAAAQELPEKAPVERPTQLLLNVTLGFQQWPALADLSTQPFGTFEEDGLNVNGAAHIPWTHRNRSTFWLGFDIGIMSHESNITAPCDIGQVDTTVFYLAPSLRWSFRPSRKWRINLEAGAGAYRVDMREFIEIGYQFVEGTRHFDAWAPGGFVGFSVDVPFGRTRRWSLNSGARVHYADFGTVDAFGLSAGNLDGPITSFQLGFSYDWKGN